MEQLEKIIKYLDGEVIGEEKQQFEKQLNADNSLKQTLNLVQEVDKTISNDSLLTYVKKLKETQTTINAEENHHIKTRFLNHWKIIAAASIATLLIVSTVIHFLPAHKLSNDNIFASFYQRYEADLITRSDTPTEVSDLIKAIQLYDRGNYKEAITKLESIIKLDATNTAARFFIGVSYIETKNFDKAIENLNYVIIQNDTVFIEHAEWYLALCYIKTNRMNQAKPLLNKIASSNNFYKVMASDILRKTK
ncbi:MAG TPA: tetratricopeptide repeat protein [Bacteroidales bacterium]